MPDIPDKLLKSALDTQNALRLHSDAIEAMSRSVTNRTSEYLRAIKESSVAHHMAKDLLDHDLAHRAAFESLTEDLHRHVFSLDPSWLRQMEQTRQMIADYEARFRLPDMAEIGRLFDQFRTSQLSETLARFNEQHSTIQRALEGLHTPWLDAQEVMRSIAGMAELQGIGHVLKNMPSFEENVAATLRANLGDWRDPITWPPDMFKHFGVRSDFYAELGFNQALTDFPAPAFEQSLDIADLRREPPPLIARYGAPVPVSGDDGEEEDFTRTNMAHDWLQRLETQVRAFIDEQMTQAFGPEWPRHCLPNGLYEEWLTKKQKACQAGAKEWPLISYADFVDYERVICRTDNWKAVFSRFFRRPESVRESFQRLYPIRLDTMHARPITQDDELLLYVETRRMIKVIFLPRFRKN